MDAIQERLFSLKDETYRAFHSRLIPNIPSERVIGVRTPQLRALAKEFAGTDAAADFLAVLPHTYFEEMQLHSFLIAQYLDFEETLDAVNRFLPYIDNWATCDQLSPKAFRKYPEQLLPAIRQWLAANETYTVRFGIGMLMNHFLDERFAPEYPEWVAAAESEEYYINMMIAWYFATALSKQWDAVIPYFRAHRLSPWLHKKSIQKATESFRIPTDRKLYLRTLK